MGAAEGDWVGRIDYLTDAAPINRERNIRVFVAERLRSLFISVFVFLLRKKSIRAGGAQSAGSDCPQVRRFSRNCYRPPRRETEALHLRPDRKLLAARR
jgi:hypothetical protein